MSGAAGTGTESLRDAACGAVFWAEAAPDGSARAFAGAIPPIAFTLTAALPRGVTLVTQPRGVVVLTSPMLYDHQPDAAERAAPPARPPVTLAGTAMSLDNRLNPRSFSAALAAAAIDLPLWPSPAATRIGDAGALALNLAWSNGAPAAWCVVQLACTRSGQTFGFAGQCNAAGDVVVPLTGLPPLPQGQPADSMVLTARGLLAQAAAAAADTDAQKPLLIAIGAGFAAQQTIPAIRGAFNTAASLSLAAITLEEAAL